MPSTSTNGKEVSVGHTAEDIDSALAQNAVSSSAVAVAAFKQRAKDARQEPGTSGHSASRPGSVSGGEPESGQPDARPEARVRHGSGPGGGQEQPKGSGARPVGERRGRNVAVVRPLTAPVTAWDKKHVEEELSKGWSLKRVLEKIFFTRDYLKLGPQTGIEADGLGLTTVAVFVLIAAMTVLSLVMLIISISLLSKGSLQLIEQGCGLNRLLTSVNVLGVFTCVACWVLALSAAVTSWYRFRNTYFLSLFVGILCAILFLLFVFIAGMQKSDLDSKMRSGMESAMNKVQSEEQTTDYATFWNHVQLHWRCCGVEGYEDWVDSSWYTGSDTTMTTLSYTVTREWPASCCSSSEANWSVDWLRSHGVRVDPYALESCYANGADTPTQYTRTQGCLKKAMDYVDGWCNAFIVLYLLLFIMTALCITGVTLIEFHSPKLAGRKVPLPSVPCEVRRRQRPRKVSVTSVATDNLSPRRTAAVSTERRADQEDTLRTMKRTFTDIFKPSSDYSSNNLQWKGALY